MVVRILGSEAGRQAEQGEACECHENWREGWEELRPPIRHFPPTPLNLSLFCTGDSPKWPRITEEQRVEAIELPFFFFFFLSPPLIVLLACSSATGLKVGDF